MEILSKNSDSSCSVSIENTTMDRATFPTGTREYIQAPITTVKQSHSRNNELTTLIHLVVHTYHPETIEPFKVHYQDMKQTNNSFEANHIDLYKDPILNKTVVLVQPSQKLAQRVFPPLLCSKGNLHFLKEFFLIF